MDSALEKHSRNTTVFFSSLSVYAYAYDQNNQRIRRTVLGTATTTYPNQYYNYSTTGSTTAHILLPDGTPIATVEANGTATTTYWLLIDHLGGVQNVANSSGAPVSTTDYYPYGSQRFASSSTSYTEQRGYIGQNYDTDSSLSPEHALLPHTPIGLAFNVSCEFCRTRYVYWPDYQKLPPNIEGEIRYTPINKDWYRIDQDWN